MITSDLLAPGHAVVFTCVSTVCIRTHTLIKIQADRRGEVNAPVSLGGPWRLRFLSRADAAGGNWAVVLHCWAHDSP